MRIGPWAELASCLLLQGVVAAGDGKPEAPSADGAAAEATPQDPDPLQFRVFWKDGLNFQTVDKSVKLQIGGRINNDWAWFNADGDLGDPALGGFDFEDGTEFRRARIDLRGRMPGNLEWRTQYDFAGGDADFRDVYLGFTDTPVGGVRIGQFKEPLSLEEMTSANYITFLERASMNVLIPSRSTGIMLYDAPGEQRLTWAAGVFRDSNSSGDQSGDGEYSVTGRLTGLPVYGDEGRSLLHLGAGASFRSPNDDSVSINAKPEVNLAPAILSTGTISGDDKMIYNVEAAWVGGPWSVQAEYTIHDVDADTGSDPTLTGYYAYLSWFVTGEHRPYKMSDGAFDKLKPKRPFGGPDGGAGAFELALRYSMLDFDDVPAGDDAMACITAGLNWYVNANTRFMFDYNMAELDEVDGDVQALNIRFQVFF